MKRIFLLSTFICLAFIGFSQTQEIITQKATLAGTEKVLLEEATSDGARVYTTVAKMANYKKSYFKGLNGTSLAIASGTSINLLTAGDAGSDAFVVGDFSTLPTMKELDVYINGVKAYRTTGTLGTSAGTAYAIMTTGGLTSNVTVNQLEIILNK